MYLKPLAIELTRPRMAERAFINIPHVLKLQIKKKLEPLQVVEEVDKSAEDTGRSKCGYCLRKKENEC